MFDKLYKEANDEIPVNMLLMESLKKEASGGKRKKSFGFMYRYGFAAAAVVIMVISLNVLPKVEKTQDMPDKYPGTKPEIVTENAEFKNVTSESSTNEESGINISEDNISQTVNLPIGEDKNDISQNNIPAYTAEGEAVVPEKKSEIKSSESHWVENNEVKTESVNETKSAVETDVVTAEDVSGQEQTEATEMAVLQQEATEATADKSTVPEAKAVNENRKVSSGGGSAGGGGGGSARASVSDNHSTGVTLEEYCDAFGFNPDLWNIPTGMSMVEGREIYTGSGETEEISHTVIYSGSGKTIRVKMFPESGEISSLINSGSGEKYNGNMILENSELSYTSYVVKNGNGYIVETNNLEKEKV